MSGGVASPLLHAQGLVKSFGGFRAVDRVSLAVLPGSVHALIGPNGAGKATLFYLLAGYLKPTSGRVQFAGRDITGLSADTIAHRGLVSAFQITHVFPRLSALENVLAAIEAKAGESAVFWRRIRASARREALALLATMGLADVADQRAGRLSHGDQRVLEVALALALATEPRLLLLDEPTAGMSPVETERTVALIRRLAGERGLTVVIVEHDVKVVFSVSDRVTVLHQGRVLCEGKPDEIRRGPAVIEIYLGAPA